MRIDIGVIVEEGEFCGSEEKNMYYPKEDLHVEGSDVSPDSYLLQ